MSSRSLSEQRSLLLDKKTRQIIEQVKDDSSSLVVLLDSASLRSSRSGSTDRDSLWSRAFEFDGDLLGSKVYKGQIRLLMKRLVGKRAKPQGTSNLTACEDLEDELQEKSQEPPEILLLGPDNYARIMLLESLHCVSDPAGKIKRYKTFKDEFIAYHLPVICCMMHDENIKIDGMITTDEKTNASLQWIRRYEESIHIDESQTQMMDALATLWKDEKTRTALIYNFHFWSSLPWWIEIDR